MNISFVIRNRLIAAGSVESVAKTTGDAITVNASRLEREKTGSQTAKTAVTNADVSQITSKRYNASNQGQVVMLVNHCASLAVHLKWRYIFASLIASGVTLVILVCLCLNKVSIIIDL